MTREQEILDSISELEQMPMLPAVRRLSPEKLAAHLARMEGSKSEEEEFIDPNPVTVRKETYKVVIPPSEEKNDLTARAFMLGTPEVPGYKTTNASTHFPTEEKKCCDNNCCGNCVTISRIIPEDGECICACTDDNCPCHSPTQEEKKCGCGPKQMSEMTGEEIANSPSLTVTQLICKEHFEERYPGMKYPSPTPPDAWEELEELVAGIRRGDDSAHINSWLRSKKKEWQREAVETYQEHADGYNAGRTTTLEELERVVEELSFEVPAPRMLGDERRVLFADDLLTRLKEMRTSK